MTVICGKAGAVTGEDTVTNWEVTYTGQPFEYYASNTDGASGQLAGNNDWSGSYKVLTGEPANMPGDGITFTGSVDGTNGCTGTAIIDSITVTAPIAAGGPVTTVVAFSSDGALTVGAAAATDTTEPQPPPAKLAKLNIAAGDIAGVQSITMVITSANKDYVTSGETNRIAGNLTATLTYDILEGDFGNLPAPNADLIIKFYVTATIFWDLKWMLVENLTNLKVDIETNELVGATVNTKFNGFVSGVHGWIGQPGGTDLWGTVVP